MPINSKQKGKRGELDFVNLCKDYGINAQRGQQFKGTKDSPDIIWDLPFHCEIKFTETLNPYKFYEQACNDCGDKIPIVAFRKKRKKWLITLSAKDFLKIALGE